MDPDMWQVYRQAYVAMSNLFPVRNIDPRPGIQCFIGHYLLINMPKGFVPQQDNGLMWGDIQADQSISFQLMEKKLAEFVDIVREDPAVAHVDGFYYGGSYGDVFVVLKPLSEREVSAQQVAGRLQPKHPLQASLCW